jgi:hypothetical protein
MSSLKSRLLRSDSQPLLLAVTVTVSAIALLSFVLSFNSLTELAIAARIPTTVAWGWGLIVDGTIVVATFGTLLLHDRASKTVKAYPWVILVLFGALSIYANGIHAIASELTDVEAFVVGAVAPVALLTATHLLVIMLTSPVRGATDAELARAEAKEAAAAAAAAAHEARRAQVVAVDAPVAQARTQPPAAPKKPAQRAVTAPAATPVPAAQRAEVIARIHAHRAEHGEWPSGGVVGPWLGASAKTGLRLVNSLRDAPSPE